MGARARIIRVLVLALIPLVAFAVLGVWSDLEQRQARVDRNQMALARAGALTTQAVVEGHLRTLESLAADLRDGSATDIEALRARLTRYLAANPEWEGMSIIGPDGWNTAAPSTAPGAVFVGDRDYVRTVLDHGRTTIGSAVIGRVTGQPVVVIATPVELSGIRHALIAPVPTERMTQRIKDRLGSDRAVVIVDQAGRTIVHPDRRRIQSLEDLSSRPYIQAALAGDSDTVTAEIDGVDTLLSYVPVERLGWVVLIQEPVHAAYSPLYRSTVLSTGLVGVSLAAALVIAWVLAGRLATTYSHLERSRLDAEAARGDAEVASERYADLVEGLDAIVWEAEAATFKFTFVSRRAEQVLGYPVGRWTSDPNFWADHIHPDDRERTVEFSRVSTQRGEDHTLEYRAVSADGREVWLVDIVRVIHDSEGKPSVLRGLMLDITERVKSEQERAALLIAEQDARGRAEAAVRARDEFLSIASHELRNPVAAVKGAAQLLRRLWERGQLTDDRIDHYSGTMVEMGDRIGRLLQDLLDVGRLERGQFELRIDDVDLADAVRHVVDDISTSLLTSRIHVGTAEGSARVMADRDRVQQILQNLLDNALKYSPPETSIDVTLRREAGGVAVRVRDRGIGLPPGSEEEIFKPFGRGPNAAALPGMGLGLYISRRLAEAHGGRLEVVSDGAGRGSVFTLWLPAVPASVLLVQPDEVPAAASVSLPPLVPTAPPAEVRSLFSTRSEESSHETDPREPLVRH